MKATILKYKWALIALLAVVVIGLFYFNRGSNTDEILSGDITKERKINPKNDLAVTSYGIGLNVGEGLQRQDLKVDVGLLAMGIRDSLAEKSPRVDEETIKNAFKKLNENKEKKKRAVADKNKKAAKKFLAKNAKKDGIKTTKSGLQYEILTEGKGDLPKEEDRISVHYKGTLIDGTEFDSSYARNEPAEFFVNRVIVGWTEALQLMKEGG